MMTRETGRGRSGNLLVAMTEAFGCSKNGWKFGPGCNSLSIEPHRDRDPTQWLRSRCAPSTSFRWMHKNESALRKNGSRAYDMELLLALLARRCGQMRCLGLTGRSESKCPISVRSHGH